MTILRKLGWFFRLYWKRYAIAFVALLMISCLAMVAPWITGQLVDAIANDTLIYERLVQEVGLLLSIGIVIYGLRVLWRRQLYGASFKLAALMRGKIYDHLTLMAPDFFQRHHTGDLMARATNDVTAVEMTAGEAILALFDGVMTGVAVLVMMVVMVSWKLTLLALLPWPIMGYFMWRFGHQMHDTFSEAQRQFSLLNDKTQESITGIRLIKAFGQQPQMERAYHDVTRDVSAANLAVAKVEAKYDPVIYLTVSTSFFLAVAGGAWLIYQDELTIGELTSFTMYLTFLIWPMFAYGWTLNLIERGSAAHKRIDELLQTTPTISDHGTRDSVESTHIDVSIKRFAYDEHSDVLHHIHFKIPPGSTFGIVGHTGSGKSTLIQLLLRMHEGSEAALCLGQHDIREYKLETLRRQFGLVPQDPFLFSVTIAENIALGCPEASLDDVRAAARLACIDDEILNFPEQYETLVGERGITLSGGQKQRIAIARALLIDPPVLILDDALSAVDLNTERQILARIKAARHGRSNIIVCHRLSAVLQADEIIVLRHGTIEERGRHTQLLQLNGWYAQMFRYQQIEAAVQHGE
ncbi:MAG: ATP-binding cassette domain-containing protein [Thiotrichaceae bacterium]|nr:ATP-binding cassette domain-containing protein [Thiotrichaceae bacterium]PCI10351.1 MAG: multidrug ABC transporter permease/ATP-binding protein [Thiotrichales bacterium]